MYTKSKKQKQRRRRYIFSYILRAIGVALGITSVIGVIGLAGAVDTETITNMDEIIGLAVKYLVSTGIGFLLTLPYRQWFGE